MKRKNKIKSTVNDLDIVVATTRENIWLHIVYDILDDVICTDIIC